MPPKSQVYSWRLSLELKRALEAEARRRNLGLAELLENVTRGWLAREVTQDDSDAVRVRARKWFGALSSGEGSRRSEHVRELVRERLQAKHGRDRTR